MILAGEYRTKLSNSHSQTGTETYGEIIKALYFKRCLKAWLALPFRGGRLYPTPAGWGTCEAVKTGLKDQTSNLAFPGHVHVVALTHVKLFGQHIQDAHIDIPMWPGPGVSPRTPLPRVPAAPAQHHQTASLLWSPLESSCPMGHPIEGRQRYTVFCCKNKSPSNFLSLKRE